MNPPDPLVNTIVELLRSAGHSGVSDLFLTCGKRPSFRKNGLIRTDTEAPVIVGEAIDAFRSACLGESGAAYYHKHGVFDASFSPAPGERCRINFYSTLRGPAMAVRPVLNGSELYAEKLGLPSAVNELCEESRGLILITGTTGSGKSTTLGAMINRINRTSGKHILTIEDPIEFLHEDVRSLISQREIHTGETTFAEALRGALRENPDIIVIGEMRDADTMRTALDAAMTGHLVIGTLHTADTIQSVERVINLFPEEQRAQTASDLALSLTGILSQRLIPSASGSGMLPALEILRATPTVRKQIEECDYRALEDTLKRGSASGMVSFTRSIFRMFKEKRIRLESAREAVSNRDEFNLLVRGMESGVDAFRSQYGGDADAEDGSFVDMRTLLRSALQNGASDLILSAGTSPSLRLNGALNALDLPAMSDKDIQRLLFSVITRHQRIELEEKRELDFALSVALKQKDGEEQHCRFRINGFYQRGSLGVVARVVNLRIPTPEELTLPPAIVRLATKQQGLILVTGPTGSGKSTTLASLLNLINRTRASHIITIEDPIEYVHENVNSIVEQRELHADTLSFEAALKYALRQNPDVIMVGEMRDVDTMAAVLTAAETGHLVLATIHTNSAPQTVDRIVDSFPTAHQNQIRLQLASVLLGVLSQRLLPRVGASGRVAAFEVLIGTPPVQSIIREGKTHQLQSVMETSSKDGMVTLEKAMENLFQRGLVAETEIARFRADYKQIQNF